MSNPIVHSAHLSGAGSVGPPDPPAVGATTTPDDRPRRQFLHYVLRRIGYAVVVVWSTYTLSFILLWALPSNPAQLMLAASGAAPTKAAVEAAMKRYGLDQNIFVQYFTMLGRALRGDLGDAISGGRPVTTVIAENVTPTVQLGLTSLAIGTVLGVAIALAANATRLRWLRTLLFSVPPFIGAIPTFWLGLVVIQIFAFRLRLLPAVSGTSLAGLVLPALTLGVLLSAGIAQVTAQGLDENLRSPYADYLRARGVPRRRILVSHTLRNALIPVTTLLGVYVGALFVGAVITETVFSRPGLGRVLQAAVTRQDIPVVQGVVVLCALSFAVFNLVVDLLYPLIDPRISAL